MVSKEQQVDESPGINTPKIDWLKCAIDSTALGDARAQQELAGIDILASSANNTAMNKTAVHSQTSMAYRLQPKCLRYNLWSNEEESSFGYSATPPCLADWTEYAKLLPSVPKSEFENVKALNTIQNNPNLFKIITPVNVDRFEELLKLHPNRPFVESICRGL